MSRWRAQGLFAGLITVAATGFGMLALAAVAMVDAASVDQALPGALLLLIPAGLIDAMLALPLLALIRAMLASAALQPAVPVRLGPNAPSASTSALASMSVGLR